MSILRKSSYLPDFEAAALPLASIFRKLNNIDPNIHYELIEQALKAQLERHNQPRDWAELNAAIPEKLTLKQIVKTTLENMGLRFLFKSKAAPETVTPPPERLERKMNQPPPDRITKPHDFSKDRLNNDQYIVDPETITDDLRHALINYLENMKPKLALTDAEQESLKPQARPKFN